MTNHPVHLLDTDGNFSPTALIPFCEFGGDMATMGVKLDNLDVPVCNSFKAKIFNDQLCYTVDPNKYRNVGNLEKDDDLSLALYINYNEDREASFSGNLDVKKNIGKYIHVGSLGTVFHY